MKVTDKLLSRLVDFYYKHRPRKSPAIEKLRNCKIISHRGEHDNIVVFENTLPAFDKAVRAGVWGIEFDVRWTKDLCPIVFHDQDCQRIFGRKDKISEMTFREVSLRYPSIPTLEDVVNRYGRRTHLMIEIKKDHYPNFDLQVRELEMILISFRPGDDYHFLSLDPEMFDCVSFVEKQFCLPIAEKNTEDISVATLHQCYGGITGHYVLLSDEHLSRHREAGQKIGTGQVNSFGALFREVDRGVDWIFSNNATELQQVVNI
jgi:glycerophosphoryl diester phosphodiesterase